MELLNLLRGKTNLAITFWGWAICGTFIVKLLWDALFELVVPNHIDASAHTWLIYGTQLAVLSWSILIAIAVFNSAGQYGRRSVWGWAATLVAVAGIFVPLYISIILFTGLDKTWEDVERDVINANSKLPKAIGESLILTRVRSDFEDNSVTFILAFDAPTISRQTFDRKAETNKVLAHCDQFANLLYYPVETARFVFKALDESNALVLKFPTDCGIKIYKLGPNNNFLPRAFHFQARW